MALTASFKQSIKAAPAPGSVPQGQPMTPEQFQSWVGSAPTAKPGIVDQVKQAAQGGINQVKEGFNQSNTAQNPLQLVEGAAKMGAGAVNTAFSPLAPVTKPIGDAVNAVANKVSDIPAVQKFATSKAGEVTSRVAEDVGNLSTIAGAVAGTKGAPEAASTVAEKAGQLTKPAEVAPEVAAKTAADTAKANTLKAHDMIDKEVRNVGEKYGDVGKALNNAEVTKGTEPIKVLASYPEGKALPAMSKGGKMNSLPAINYLRTQVKALGKIKGDLVDTAKQNISVKDFQKTIEDQIDSGHGSQAAKDAQKADIAKEMDRLQKSYPDGIPTKEMDKLKSEHANESNSYKTTGFPSRFAPDTHSTIADNARTLVEKQGGAAPIEELNKWISSHHDAIKVLEKMHGKTPHGGMFSRHVGGIAGEVAGLAGGMALGHPFLGAMAGRGASEVVNNILSSHFISNPLKRSIIDTMKGVDPGVIQKAKDFLNQEAGASQGSPTETPQSPSLPASVPESTAKSTDQSLAAPQPESTLSFLKNNISGKDSQRGFASFGGKKPTAALKGAQAYTKEAASFLKKQPSYPVLRMLDDYNQLNVSGKVPEGFKNADEFKKAVRSALTNDFGIKAFDMTDDALWKFSGAVLTKANPVK